MGDYLTEGWPFGPTSTVYMSGTSLYSVRRYGKPGIVASVELRQEQAEAIREVIEERIREAQAQALEQVAEEWAVRSQMFLDTMQHMVESREYSHDDILRYGAYSAEAQTSGYRLKTRAAAIRDGVE